MFFFLLQVAVFYNLPFCIYLLLFICYFHISIVSHLSLCFNLYKCFVLDHIQSTRINLLCFYSQNTDNVTWSHSFMSFCISQIQRLNLTENEENQLIIKGFSMY